MRALIPALMLSFGLIACGDEEDSADSGSVEVSAACELAAEIDGCPECADGDVTCSYGDESATALSCGDCQARVALLDELCAAEIEDSRADIEAGLSCSEPE